MVSATFMKPNFPNFVFNPKTKYLKNYYATTFGCFVEEKKISKKISKINFKIRPFLSHLGSKIEMYLYLISKSASFRNQQGRTISVRSCVINTKSRFPSSCFLGLGLEVLYRKVWFLLITLFREALFIITYLKDSYTSKFFWSTHNTLISPFNLRSHI